MTAPLDDSDGLSVTLACQAIEFLGKQDFTVFANLSSANPASIENFGRFREVLMMAYRRGFDDAQALM